MKLLKWAYEKSTGKSAPYYYNYSLITIIGKPIRKFVAQVLAPNCPFNSIRILLYRLCGFRIGKHTFIGMKCYLDDTCYDLLKIGDNVTISYGVYFASHGRKQGHCQITIQDGAYIGMRANIITKNAGNDVGGGDDDWEERNYWRMHTCKSRCSRGSYRCWCSMQNNQRKG